MWILFELQSREGDGKNGVLYFLQQENNLKLIDNGQEELQNNN